MSIGSTSISSTKFCNLFIFGDVNDLIEGFQMIEIYSAVVDKSTTVSAEFLSIIYGALIRILLPR